jgi:hypothetical protein
VTADWNTSSIGTRKAISASQQRAHVGAGFHAHAGQGGDGVEHALQAAVEAVAAHHVLAPWLRLEQGTGAGCREVICALRGHRGEERCEHGSPGMD